MKRYLSASVDNGTDSCTIQSTSCYTDLLIEHLIKLPVNVMERKDRLCVVAFLSIPFFVQMFSRDFCMPHFERASLALLQRLQISFPLLPILSMVVSLLSTIPGCMVINKYGIEKCLLCLFAVALLGTGIRCLSIGDSTLIFYVTAVFLSSVSSFLKPLAAALSISCFLPGRRNLASGFLTIASMAGAVGGFLMKTDNFDTLNILCECILYPCISSAIFIALLDRKKIHRYFNN